MRFGDELAWKVWQALCKAVPDELKVSGEKHSEEHKKGALTIALVISELADRFQRICSEEGVLHAVLYIRNILSRLHAKVARLTCLDQPDAVFAGIIDELPVDMECVEASLEALDECSGQKESEA